MVNRMRFLLGSALGFVAGFVVVGFLYTGVGEFYILREELMGIG